jgi:hypothetical protein
MSQMFLNVVSTFKGDGLNAATRQLGAFGSAAGGLGSTLGKVGAALASFGIAAKAVQFTSSSIESARDLERNLFSVNTIFGELAPRMVRFSKNAENIGLSQKDAAKAVTFLGSVLKQSGFAMDDVVVQSEKLVTLGVDLAATYGYDVQEALLGMTALFRGEYDPIEKFGVAMKQAEINAVLAERGLNKLTGAALRNAEQTVRMELLYERAADASGAFTAQTGNLFVEQKKLSAQFENMQATVGTALLPAMGELVQTLVPLVDEITPRLIQVVKDAGPAIKNLTDFMRDLSDKSTTTGSTMSGLADVVGEFFRFVSENFGVIVQLTLLIGGLRVAFLLLSAAMATTPFGWAVIGLGLLGASLIMVKEAYKDADEAAHNYNLELMRKDPILQAINPQRAYTGILGDTMDGLNKTRFAAEDYSATLTDFYKIDLDPHMREVLGIRDAWNDARDAAGFYKINAPGADMSAGFKPGMLDTEVGTGTGTATGGGSSAKAVISGLPALVAASKKNAKVLKKEVALGGKGLSTEVAKWITSSNTPVKAANQALNRIAKNGDKAIKNLTRNYNNSAAGQQAAAAAFAQAESDRIAAAAENKRIADELAAAEQARIEEQKRVYESFLDSVKNTFSGIKNAIMGAFNITGLGGSTNSVIRNMEKMLVRLRSFSTSVKQLATMGLDPALLQQVISMGPMAGARLASALVEGGAGALGAINTGFGEFGSLAGEIARTGTQSSFGTDAQNRQFTINVNGGVGSGATIGKAIVDAIADYERTSGAVWTRA